MITDETTWMKLFDCYVWCRLTFVIKVTVYLTLNTVHSCMQSVLNIFTFAEVKINLLWNEKIGY